MSEARLRRRFGWLSSSRSAPYLPLLLAAVLALAVGARQPLDLAADGRTLVAEAYNSLVAELVASGQIVPNPKAQSEPSRSAPSVVLSKSARVNLAVRAFVENSYLKRDLMANDGRWRIAGARVLGLDPRIHSLRLPFAEERSWRGRVAYRQADPARWSNYVLIPQSGSPLTLTGQASAGETAAMVGALDGRVLGTPGQSFEFVDGIGAGRQHRLARFAVIGDRPVLTVDCAAGRSIAMHLASFVYPPDPCVDAKAGSISLVLSPGDTISFSPVPLPRGRMSFVLSRQAGDLSAPGVFSERFNSGDAGMLGQSIAQAMDEILANPAYAAQISPSQNVMLTLDRPIQRFLDRSFSTYAAGLGERLDRTGDDPVVGAAVVMDALNGEILGLGSASPWPRRGREANPRNQAFVPMAVGSAAKVPVSAAIFSRYPALRLLCAYASELGAEGEIRFDRVLGIRLESDLVDTMVGGPYGFSDFLAHSSNRYAAQLLMLASSRVRFEDEDRFSAAPSVPAATLADQDRYGFSDLSGSCADAVMIEERPAFAFPFMPASGGMPSDRLRITGNLFDALGQDNWIDRMVRLFDMPGLNPRLGASPFASEIWSPARDGPFSDQAFAAISPDREDFHFEDMQQLRGEYLQVMLGGGNARWSAVKLAEAYARIFSGTRVEARLQIRGGGNAPPGPLSDLSSASQRALLDAMEAVVTRGSAARLAGVPLALSSASGSGESYRLYAKTGTPTLEVASRSAVNALHQKLVETQIVRLLEGDRIGVAQLSGESFADALLRQARDRSIGITSLQASEVERWLRAVNAALVRGEPTEFQFDSQRRLTLAADTSVRRGPLEIDEGGVAALVLAKYCTAGSYAASAQVRPTSAVSIVVNIAARSRAAPNSDRSGANPALDYLAADLLRPDGPVAGYLRRTNPCR